MAHLPLVWSEARWRRARLLAQWPPIEPAIVQALEPLQVA